MATTILMIVFPLISLLLVVTSQSVSIMSEYTMFQGQSDEVIAAVLGDQNHHRRRQLLHTKSNLTAMTFARGDVTTQISSLGMLHYAQMRVGTPPVSFLVALDTGSVISWLPCGCLDCAPSFETDSGQIRNLNSYRPGSSSTSANISCDNPQCGAKMQCRQEARAACPYEVNYLSVNTSTKGYLVQDVLHLESYDNERHAIDAPIIFGCGTVETGANLHGGTINGLLGLGLGQAHTESLDVPGVLASQGLVPNAFSLCFASNGSGRFAFGDKGDTDQKKTPLEILQDNEGYNIRIQQIAVENVVTHVDFIAMVDSGTSFTFLNPEAYAFITENFNSHVKEPRIGRKPEDSFEYCYSIMRNRTTNWAPSLTLKMRGGADYHVKFPTVALAPSPIETEEQVYCLGIIKNTDFGVNIIGQNFMAGYRIVFDREESVIGWKPSNCIAKEANPRASSNAALKSMADRLAFILVFFLTY